ncbi:hypothetical protein U9M48_014361 [Paspalum notatum var. saurae]|uniref:SprT-like domain-containing protein n=1 Tax=Paspalum notatum var. saurae TaxID=547442 RepID=A0AAQ3T453_PASNO
MGDAVEAADLVDPNPDVQDLFKHYDGLYFRGALADAGFSVRWGSPLGSSSFGSCTFSKPHNTITLSEPVLKYHSCTDLKNALLHEMIHAIIFVKRDRRDRQHGPLFRAWMDAINSCSVKDHQRPDGGYYITTRHDFSPEEPRSFKGVLWKCESCGDTIPRAINMGPPSDACCIENDGISASCGNMLCHWHNHKNGCCGHYKKTMLDLDAPSQRGNLLLLTFPSEMSKSKGAIQEASPSALQGNIKATKLNAGDKHLCLASGRNGKPLGSSTSKKANKRRMPEIDHETSVLPIESPLNASGRNGKPLGSSFSKKARKRHMPVIDHETSVLPVESPLNGKEDLAAAENDLFSLIGRTAAQSSSSTPKKAGKRHEPVDVQKPTGLPAAHQGKSNQKSGLVATERQEVLSVEAYNDAKPLGNDTSKKAGKQHKPDDFQKTNVVPSASLGMPKLEHVLVTTEKDNLSTAQGRTDAKSPGCDILKKAGERYEPQITQKACSQPAYPQKRLNEGLLAPVKKEHSPLMGCGNENLLDRSFSKKAHRQREHEDIRKTIVLPDAPRIELKAPIFVASEKQLKGKRKRKPAREKEYAVVIPWLDYYESDRSSGSTEPLVNKRTERRRRERERARILTYSRSKKIDPAPFVNSGKNASIRNHRIKMAPCKDESMQKSGSPSLCLDNIVLSAADKAVVTPATGDQSQRSDPAPTDLGIAPDIIYISDDD